MIKSHHVIHCDYHAGCPETVSGDGGSLDTIARARTAGWVCFMGEHYCPHHNAGPLCDQCGLLTCVCIPEPQP
jgi:hypothetical protein